jgi:penicillin amidase
MLQMLGSNNWVISPNFTTTGRPILANHPHLVPLRCLPPGSSRGVETPDYTVMGVAFPGAPVVVIGTNGYVAWGFTNTGVDVIDYYYYVWNGTRYYYNGSWLEAERRAERFSRSATSDNRCAEKTLEVLETHARPRRGVRRAEIRHEVARQQRHAGGRGPLPHEQGEELSPSS